MHARLCISRNYPERFCVTNGVKQGCVIAPILFKLFFAATLGEALPSSAEVILIRFSTDGGIFNSVQFILFAFINYSTKLDVIIMYFAGSAGSYFAYLKDWSKKLERKLSIA